MVPDGSHLFICVPIGPNFCNLGPYLYTFRTSGGASFLVLAGLGIAQVGGLAALLGALGGLSGGESGTSPAGASSLGVRLFEFP